VTIAPIPLSSPAIMNEPNLIRFTRTPDSLLTSRLAPTNRMWRPRGVKPST
jgi:hypothetical protein